MKVVPIILYVGYAAFGFNSWAAAFCPPSKRTAVTFYQPQFLHLPKSITTTTPGTILGPRMRDTKLRDRLWERLEIEEDDEPMWYLLNCVAGLELELLYQCREVCGDMEDVVKFIVPTVKKTRSHGAKRMVTEHKVKYLGYVFAKLRLCKATYERIQSLDLCRSWMGTVNHKGYRKLPPSPLALNEDEIANFGLEEWVEEEDTLGQASHSEDAILDSGDDDTSVPQVDTEAIKSFLGLKVEDMVKVTARNKFFNEEGVIRRLKDGKIMVRFLTYGTMFEEWLDPSDVRKLTELEALRGLSGPTKPITQRELDGPTRGRDHFDASSNPDFNRQQLRQAPPRNRRQDRTADRFNSGSGGSLSEQQTNDRNWNWYQEQQREQKGSNPSWTAGSGASSSDKTDNEWAMGDVDSQWGRRRQVSPREQRRNERTQNENRRTAAAINGDDDWSAFVSSATNPTSSEKDSSEDDFFASLMSDLKKDLKNADKVNGGKSSSNLGDDSGFFDSLLDQQDATRKTAKPQQSSNVRSNNAYSNSNNGNKRARSTPKFGESQEDSLFFDSLLDDLDADKTPPKKPLRFEKPKQASRDGDDDFFAALEAELEGAFGDGDDSSSAFFAQLESELTSSSSNERRKKTMEQQREDNTDTLVSFDTIAATSQPSTGSKSGSLPTGSTDPSSLAKCTVPVLKEMLRERGLKISGTKADLIERLIQG